MSNKVKITTFETIVSEHETLEYPLYLYFQLDDFSDEYLRVMPDNIISIRHSFNGLEIKQTKYYAVHPHYLDHTTTKEHFEEVFNNTFNWLKID